ncbi:LuxR C-terminal-related transcriptional regulator [Bradyrhizobium jicamae]|uniref:LuxR C-terminal-related transcriptional regulator n=1 Tax=Bradyrhizobium jicamae TaxID=280332 RepID=UPI0020137A23|nr:response regulator transcription factor [Bradyrhizobium jicamae]
MLILLVYTGDDFEGIVEQIEVLRERHPKARLAVVADHYRPQEMVAALRAGANGYFIDVMKCDVFVKSIELIMMGETIFPPAFMASVVDPEIGRLDRAVPHDVDNAAILLTPQDKTTQLLSPREKSIMKCLIAGDSNKSIARKIDIAEATVKVHVKAILRKIRVQNRTQAAIWGMNNGSLVRPANDTSEIINERPPQALQMVSGLKQIEGPGRLDVLSHQANHVEPPIGRLIRKSVSRIP